MPGPPRGLRRDSSEQGGTAPLLETVFLRLSPSVPSGAHWPLAPKQDELLKLGSREESQWESATRGDHPAAPLRVPCPPRRHLPPGNRLRAPGGGCLHRTWLC